MAAIKTSIPSLKLNDGTLIPMLAYGTGTAWSKRGSTAEEDVDRKLVEGIKTAIGMGYRHFDCAESELSSLWTSQCRKHDTGLTICANRLSK
jgi:hypothetical protein